MAQNDKDKYWYIVEEMYQSGQLPQNNWKSEFFNKKDDINSIKELKNYYPFLKEVDSIALQASKESSVFYTELFQYMSILT